QRHTHPALAARACWATRISASCASSRAETSRERTRSATAHASSTGEPADQEPRALLGQRTALGEIGGKPAEQGAELEGMSRVAAEHHDAVDRIEDEVAVGRH